MRPSCVRIYNHEPSRHLFLGIADAAERLAKAEDADDFLEKLFELDREFHPNAVTFTYMMPYDDRLKVDLNGQFVYDAKFFLPIWLEPSIKVIRALYSDLIRACGDFHRRMNLPGPMRSDIGRYHVLRLRLGPATKDRIIKAATEIRDYFLKPHLQMR